MNGAQLGLAWLKTKKHRHEQQLAEVLSFIEKYPPRGYTADAVVRGLRRWIAEDQYAIEIQYKYFGNEIGEEA